MNDLATRLSALVLAPSPVAAGAPDDGTPPARARRSGRRPRPAAPVTPPTVAVLGDAGAATLAVDLALALARRERHRCALALVWGGAAPAPRQHPTRAAAQLGTDLDPILGLTVSCGGTAVVARVPDDADAAAAALDAVLVAAGPEAATVVAVCGPRPAAFDVLLSGRDLIVASVPEGAPPGLGELAAAGLEAVAPRARVITLARPAASVPRAIRHRRAVKLILGQLA